MKAIYQTGDGVPDCPHCAGRGAIDVPPDPSKGRITPGVMRCRCVELRDLLHNMRRGWQGLERATSAESSPLGDWVRKNLCITATKKTFRSHLYYTVMRQSSNWRFAVMSDADLMDIWLNPLDRQGEQVLDPDYHPPVVSSAVILGDLVREPTLLIIYLGVKAARNAAMPEVLTEALHQRLYSDIPTWVVDQPHRLLEPGHLAYSEDVMEAIDGWPVLHLDEDEDEPEIFSSGGGSSSTQRKTLGGG